MRSSWSAASTSAITSSGLSRPRPDASGRCRLNPEDVIADIEASLQELRTDRIDLYLLHRDDPSLPVGPLVEVLHAQVRAGKVRAVGASNWTQARLAEANAWAAQHGLTRWVATSPQFGLAAPTRAPWPGCVSLAGPAGAADVAAVADAKLAVLCWSPLGGGFFSGRFRKDTPLDSFKTYFERHTAKTYGSPDNFERLERAERFGAERGLSPSQVALAWALTAPFPAFPIISTHSVKSLREALEAQRLELTGRQRQWLDLHTPTAAP